MGDDTTRNGLNPPPLLLLLPRTTQSRVVKFKIMSYISFINPGHGVNFLAQDLNNFSANTISLEGWALFFDLSFNGLTYRYRTAYTKVDNGTMLPQKTD